MGTSTQQHVITEVAQIIPTWLTSILQRHDPTYPTVTNVTIDTARTTNFSSVVRLHLSSRLAVGERRKRKQVVVPS